MLSLNLYLTPDFCLAKMAPMGPPLFVTGAFALIRDPLRGLQSQALDMHHD